MCGGSKSAAKIIHQRRLLRHFRKPRIFSHQHVLAGIFGHERRPALHLHLAVGKTEQDGLCDDVLQLMHHMLFERVGALGKRGFYGVSMNLHLILLTRGRLSVYGTESRRNRGARRVPNGLADVASLLNPSSAAPVSISPTRRRENPRTQHYRDRPPRPPTNEL